MGLCTNLLHGLSSPLCTKICTKVPVVVSCSWEGGWSVVGVVIRRLFSGTHADENRLEASLILVLSSAQSFCIDSMVTIGSEKTQNIGKKYDDVHQRYHCGPDKSGTLENPLDAHTKNIRTHH
jgi:hypothetical protein